MSNVYLVHHGIKGQKWGVRRYQNEDGSLTSAGKKRYSDAKANYKQAKKDFNKAFNYAYNRSSIHVTKKGRVADADRWGKAQESLDRLNKTKNEYKSAKKEYSIDKKAAKMTLRSSEFNDQKEKGESFVKNREAVLAKMNYKQAKKDFNKAFNYAYNRSSIHVTKKGKEAETARWEKAQESLDRLNEAKKTYNSVKKRR